MCVKNKFGIFLRFVKNKIDKNVMKFYSSKVYIKRIFVPIKFYIYVRSSSLIFDIQIHDGW